MIAEHPGFRAAVGAGAYLGVLVWVVFAAPIEFFPGPAGPPPIVQAEFARLEANTPDEVALAAPDWSVTALPDDWNGRHEVREVWYRVYVVPDADEVEDAWAVYLPMVAFNAAVWVNGTWVGQGGSFEDPLSRHWNEPLLFGFSRSLLGDRAEVLVRVRTTVPRKGYLEEFYVAPLSRLMPAYEWKYGVRVALTMVIAAALLVIAGLMIVLWLIRRNETAYAYYAAASLAWSVHFLNSFVSDIPVNERTWEALIYVALGWGVVAIVLFNHRFVNVSMPRVERALKIFALCGVAILVLPDINLVNVVSVRFWHLGLVVVGIYSIAFLTIVLWRRPSVDVFLMILAGLTILTCGVHDFLVVNYLWDKGDSIVIQYGVSSAILLFTWFLVRRFAGSLTELETLNASLEARVEEREAELAREYERARDLREERALAHERERIMQDMHDGLGGQLVSLLASLRNQGAGSGTVRRVEDILSDLRLVINSLDPSLRDIATLLGVLRSSLMNQLDGTGVYLQWRVTELPESNLSPDELLHVMRIVQEAMTNLLKHTDSKVVWLDTGRSDDARIVLEIGGNGHSTATEESASGVGLRSMRARAERLGATLHVRPEAVELIWPVDRASTADPP